MAEPTIKIGSVSNIYVRQMHFVNAGDIEYGHSHKFDHLSLLSSGKVMSIVDGKESVFEAPMMIFIKKDIQHEFIALEDNTVLHCVHAIRNGEKVEDIVDPESIPAGIKPEDIPNVMSLGAYVAPTLKDR
jgi:hypothetical protein